MDPFETQLRRTITTLEEMLANYRERIPFTHLPSFKRAVLGRIARAKAHLFLHDNIA
ncbi:hypothetical protein [Cupriavidus gilardii]|uniref:hypothetical protein n=1 Tax=Cupriavidus gilardii TaxID=82541 RepID=UPI0021B4A32F|nr:hypothetical protein [Cupriavidus gilardii]UXC36646.1 hypothetical protein N4G38_04055 [Cupriavidus gilardii]